LKFIDVLAQNTLILRNWATLAIVANILALMISFFYFELATVFATLSVTALFTMIHIKAVKNSIQTRTFYFYPFLMYQRQKISELFFGLLVFVFNILKNLVFVGFISIIQRVFFNNQADYVSSTLDAHVIITGIGVVFAMFLVAHLIASCLDDYSQISIRDQRQSTIDTYHLKYQDTYFFKMNNKIIGFSVGKNSFEVDLGLKIGRKRFTPEIVLEYLSIAGIEFHELDDGHIKNIEMYAIGT
jgi:hypothetical protein